MGVKFYKRFREIGPAMAVAGVLAASLIWAAPAWPGHGGSGPMPEFTTTSEKLWINSKPLKKADLKGKVLLLEVWTSI